VSSIARCEAHGSEDWRVAEGDPQGGERAGHQLVHPRADIFIPRFLVEHDRGRPERTPAVRHPLAHPLALAVRWLDWAVLGLELFERGGAQAVAMDRCNRRIGLEDSRLAVSLLGDDRLAAAVPAQVTRVARSVLMRTSSHGPKDRLGMKALMPAMGSVLAFVASTKPCN
jgi:hypothetical protein